MTVAIRTPCGSLPCSHAGVACRPAGRAWRGVAAVGQCMHNRLHARPVQNIGQRDGVILMRRVHTARRHQAQQMAGATRRLHFSRSVRSAPARAGLPSPPSLTDARRTTPSPPGKRPIFRWPTSGVPTLALRQADVLAGGLEGVRAGSATTGRSSACALTDCIVGRLFAPAEAVEDHQHHWPDRLRHGSALASWAHKVAPTRCRNKCGSHATVHSAAFASAGLPPRLVACTQGRGANNTGQGETRRLSAVSPYLVVDGAGRS